MSKIPLFVVQKDMAELLVAHGADVNATATSPGFKENMVIYCYQARNDAKSQRGDMNDH